MTRSKLESYQPREKTFRYFAGYVALFLGSMLASVKVIGRRHLPAEGPFVLAINHFSQLDPAIIVYAIRRPISFLMASDQDVEWYLMWAPWLYGFIPTNRTRLAPSTIKLARRALGNSEILGIFPEGTSTDSKVRPAKNGAVYLSSVTKAPIVPVGVTGLDKAWQHWFRGVRPRVTVRIGKPFEPIELPDDKAGKQQALAQAGDELMCHIAALLPDEAHGYLGDDDRIKAYRSEIHSWTASGT